MTQRQKDLQKECDESNAQSAAYIRTHYENGSPRRNYHWEVKNNQKCLVED